MFIRRTPASEREKEARRVELEGQLAELGPKDQPITYDEIIGVLRRDVARLTTDPEGLNALASVGRSGETMGQEFVPADGTMDALNQIMQSAFSGHKAGN